MLRSLFFGLVFCAVALAVLGEVAKSDSSAGRAVRGKVTDIAARHTVERVFGK